MTIPHNPLAMIPLQTGALQVSGLPPLLLVTMMPDDSGSIASYGNTQAIIRGHNELLDRSNDRTDALFMTRYLNGERLNDFRRAKDAVRMNTDNYHPRHGTPLYDQTYELLGEVMAAAALRVHEHDVITMTCILTDGADSGSQQRSPDDVRAVVERMIAGRHIVAAMGVRDKETDFHAVFRSMGIPEQWIMVLEREESDIVRGMTEFTHASRTVVGGASFHQTSRVGFTQQYGPAAPAPATAVAGAGTVGNMMGAKLRRDAEEIGGVPPASLPWEPAPMAYLWDGTGKDSGSVQGLPTPLRWNTAEGFHSLALPPEDLVYMFGRDGGQHDASVREKIRQVLEVMRRRGLNLRLMYVPIRDRRPSSSISRMHALIAARGAGVYSITAYDGDITVITGDDPASDQYRQGKNSEKAFLDRGNRVKLSPGVVIRIL